MALGLCIHCDQLQIIYSQFLLKAEGGQWAHWGYTAISGKSKTEGKSQSSPWLCYRTAMRADNMLPRPGQGSGSHPLHYQEGEAPVISVYFEHWDYGDHHMAPRDTCISRSFALRCPEIQTVSIAECHGCIIMWTWGWLSSQRWCSASEEIPFFAPSSKRNNILSPIWLHWILEKKGLFEMSSLGNSLHLVLWSLKLCRAI